MQNSSVGWLVIVQRRGSVMTGRTYGVPGVQRPRSTQYKYNMKSRKENNLWKEGSDKGVPLKSLLLTSGRSVDIMIAGCKRYCENDSDGGKLGSGASRLWSRLP